MSWSKKKIALAILISIPGSALLGFGGWYALEHALCTNTVLKEERSPNGKYRLVSFERECKGDVKNNQLSVFDGEPSIFDPRSGNLVISANPIEARWKNDEEIEVRGMPYLWKIEPRFYGIHVRYLGDDVTTPASN